MEDAVAVAKRKSRDRFLAVLFGLLIVVEFMDEGHGFHPYTGAESAGANLFTALVYGFGIYFIAKAIWSFKK